MKIGALSRQTGLPVATLRFYEQEGLLPSTRSTGNYREFNSDSVALVERIRLYRSMDLSLTGIRSMLRLEATPAASCGEVCQLIGQHLERVRAQRRRLEDLERELERLLSVCPGPSKPGDCQVLAELGGSGGKK